MRAFVLVLLIGCAGRASGVPSGGPNGTDRSAGGPSSLSNDGGLRVCDPEKEPQPCVEECDRGIPSTCATLAGHYEKVKQLSLAVTYFDRACELKDAAACVSSARLYGSGSGVPPNRAKQIELLSTACHLGDVFACNVPAKAFANGSGVPKDARRSVELFQRACAGGQETACEMLGDAGL